LGKPFKLPAKNNDLIQPPEKQRLNDVQREILEAADLRSEHCQGGAQRSEQYLDKRNEAI
jgi:hypothetical protein